MSTIIPASERKLEEASPLHKLDLNQASQDNDNLSHPALITNGEENNPIQTKTEDDQDDGFNIHQELNIIDQYKAIKDSNFTFINGLGETWSGKVHVRLEKANLIAVRHNVVNNEMTTLELFPGGNNAIAPTPYELAATLREFAQKQLGENPSRERFKFNDYMKLVSRYIPNRELLSLQRQEFYEEFSTRLKPLGPVAILEGDLRCAPLLNFAEKFTFIVTEANFKSQQRGSLLIVMNDYKLAENRYIAPLMKSILKLYKRGLKLHRGGIAPAPKKNIEKPETKITPDPLATFIKKEETIKPPKSSATESEKPRKKAKKRRSTPQKRKAASTGRPRRNGASLSKSIPRSSAKRISELEESSKTEDTSTPSSITSEEQYLKAMEELKNREDSPLL